MDKVKARPKRHWGGVDRTGAGMRGSTAVLKKCERCIWTGNAATKSPSEFRRPRHIPCGGLRRAVASVIILGSVGGAANRALRVIHRTPLIDIVKRCRYEKSKKKKINSERQAEVTSFPSTWNLL